MSRTRKILSGKWLKSSGKSREPRTGLDESEAGKEEYANELPDGKNPKSLKCRPRGRTGAERRIDMLDTKKWRDIFGKSSPGENQRSGRGDSSKSEVDRETREKVVLPDGREVPAMPQSPPHWG